MAQTCDVTLQGEVLRLLRIRAGLTQAQLAEKAGYPRERISAWESPNARHGIHEANARVLAKTLGADEDALTKTRVQDTLAQEVRRLADEQGRRLAELEASALASDANLTRLVAELTERVEALESRASKGRGTG